MAMQKNRPVGIYKTDRLVFVNCVCGELSTRLDVVGNCSYFKPVGFGANAMSAPTKGERTREHILSVSESLMLSGGFAGTSLDDILKATNLTKGAFFNHFASKAELARALVERYARNDYELFKEFSSKAEAVSEDPLQALFQFLRLFEDHIERLGGPPPGCVFAAYTYEIRQFDPSVETFIRDSFKVWSGLYEARFEKVLERHTPARPATAEDLAGMIMAIIEGGFILSRSYRDASFIVRQSRQFRQYLELLFGVEDAVS
jgi:TetR/AcrR family transcriptional repressor of nem operon